MFSTFSYDITFIHRVINICLVFFSVPVPALRIFPRSENAESWDGTHSWVDFRGCPKGQEAKCKKSRVGGEVCQGDEKCPKSVKTPFGYTQGTLFLTKADSVANLPAML